MFELTYSAENRALITTKFAKDGTVQVEMIGHNIGITPVILGDELGWRNTPDAWFDPSPDFRWYCICRLFMWSVVELQDELDIKLDPGVIMRDPFVVLNALGETITLHLDDGVFKLNCSILREMYERDNESDAMSRYSKSSVIPVTLEPNPASCKH